MAFSAVQSSYDAERTESVLGQIAEAGGPRRIKTRVSRGLTKAGFGVFLSSGADAKSVDPGEVYHVPFPAAGAQVAALHSGASSASIQTITSFNGAYGASEIQPPRAVTFAFDASTDWDPTSATLRYVNEKNVIVTETISVATSGTPSTTGKVKRPISLTVPAQTGAGGTFTMGVAALASLTEALFEGAAVRQEFKTTPNSSALYSYPGVSSVLGSGDYADAESVPVMSEGGIWVYSEAAVSDGDPVYVRTAVNGALNVLGSFAPAAGTGLTLLTKARFVRSSDAAGPAWARLAYL